jgi:hypothetical protein
VVIVVLFTQLVIRLLAFVGGASFRSSRDNDAASVVTARAALIAASAEPGSEHM